MPRSYLDLMAADASLSPRKKRAHSTRIPSLQVVVASIMHLVYCTAYFKCPTPPHREDIPVNCLSMFTYYTTIVLEVSALANLFAQSYVLLGIW